MLQQEHKLIRVTPHSCLAPTGQLRRLKRAFECHLLLGCAHHVHMAARALQGLPGGRWPTTGHRTFTQSLEL